MNYLFFMLLCLCSCKSQEVRKVYTDPVGMQVFDLNNKPFNNYTNVGAPLRKASLTQTPVYWRLNWNADGYYTNFNVFSSSNMVDWSLFSSTASTLVYFIPTDAQFFMVYGTNDDGTSALVTVK